MRILVAVKRVPAPGARINVTDDGLAVDASHLAFTTSPHEECALEEAVQIVERTAAEGAGGGEVVVITVGPPEAAEQLRHAASVGATSAVLVETDGSPWDPQRTAAALVEAIGELEADGGRFDLILFGNESADSGGFQVGVRVAVALDRPMVNGIKGIDLFDENGDGGAGGPEGGGGRVEARREVDGGYEVYRLPLPAVLGVKEGLNLPRYPTMKGRLAARKAEIASLAAATGAEPGGQALVGLRRPEEQVSTTMVLGDGPEAAPAVVDLLEELGVL